MGHTMRPRGCWGKGRRFGVSRSKPCYEIGDDKHKCYLLFTTGHIGNETFQVALVDERVVCENTLRIALSEKAKSTFRIKHTKNAQNRIADVKTDFGCDSRGCNEHGNQKLQKLARRGLLRLA